MKDSLKEIARLLWLVVIAYWALNRDVILADSKRVMRFTSYWILYGSAALVLVSILVAAVEGLAARL